MPAATDLGDGHGGLADLRLEVVGGHAHQEAELVIGLPQGRFEFGNERFGFLERRLRLGNVEFAGGAIFESGFGEFQTALLDFGVLFGEADHFFRDAEGGVGLRRVGDGDGENVVVEFDLLVEIGIGLLDAAAVLAPDVEFPLHAGTERKQVKSASWRADADDVAGFADLDAVIAASERLALREKIADGRAADGAVFKMRWP